MREHQEKVMHIKDTYSIFRKGNVLATVKKTLVAPMRQCLVVHVAGVENVEVEGDIAHNEGSRVSSSRLVERYQTR